VGVGEDDEAVAYHRGKTKPPGKTRQRPVT
jgi:hypothetical protein